jgi:hypothetical protein
VVRDGRRVARVLDTLARVYRRHVDEERRRLVTVETAIARLAADDARLARTLNDEAACARTEPDIAGATFAAFATATAGRRKVLAETRDEATTKANGVRTALVDAFSDQKRLEEVATAIRRRQAADTARRERAISDEQAIVRYRRRAETDPS